MHECKFYETITISNQEYLKLPRRNFLQKLLFFMLELKISNILKKKTLLIKVYVFNIFQKFVIVCLSIILKFNYEFEDQSMIITQNYCLLQGHEHVALSILDRMNDSEVINLGNNESKT